MPHAVDIELAGQAFTLLPERAAWWPARAALLVADVHLGKGAAFRRHGLAVPAGSSAADLGRLAVLVRRHRARELWVLGDLFHAADVVHLDRYIAAWRPTLGACSVMLVHGNHDRRAVLPSRWCVDSVGESVVDGIVLRHEPHETPGACAGIAGHVHPAVRIGGGRGDRLRAPAFWLRGSQLVLPAFGSFTGGFTVTPASGERVFAVGPDAVVEIHAGTAAP